MTPPTPIALQALLSALALGWLLASARGPLRRRPRLATWLGALLAGASVASYYDFGRFHGGDPAGPLGRFVHGHEQFHYQLGSKYFPELGYDGLYVASLLAERERFPERRQLEPVRDLRSNRLVPVQQLADHARRVRSRFDPERWRHFVEDHSVFAGASPPQAVARWRRDLGYNPTPAWTAVARLLNARLPLSEGRLELLGALDVLLLALAFGAVFRSYGAAVGCASLVIFGVGYPGRFGWVGGAYLRQDWLAAWVLGLCALRRGRPAWAGAAFGYAAAVRVFPLLFLLGPALCAARDAWRGQRPVWALRLACGAAAALLLAGAAGSLAGRGPGAWREFAQRIEGYRAVGARNLIGLEGPLLFGAEIAERAWAAEPGEHWDLQVEDVMLRRELRRPLLWAAQAALLLLLAAAAWRAPPASAAVLSMAALYALTPAAGYYWLLLLAVPLRRDGASGPALLLLANLAMCAAHAATPDNLVRYGLVSTALGLFFVAWLLPDALRSARAAGSRLVESALPR